MTTKLLTRAMAISIVALPFLIAGCADTRGAFGADSCDTKVAVPDGAVTAVYFDKLGNPLGTQSEDLTGTSANQMCPAPEKPAGPGSCPINYCPITVNGRTYCFRCS